MATLLLRNIGWIVTCDDRHTRLSHAWIACDAGVITALGQEPCPVPGADTVIDLEGCLLVPGLINMHHHFFQQLTRATPRSQRAVSLEWLFGMYPLWSQIGPAELRCASLTAAAELLLTGATTSVDHSYLLPGNGQEMVEAELDAVREVGLRLHLVRSCMPVIEGDLAERLRPLLGGALDRMLDADDDALFRRTEQDVARFHDAAPGAMVRVDVGPTAIPYAKPHLMRRFADLARANGLGLHTHFLPRPVERSLCRQHTGLGTSAFLDAAGWLTPRSWFAHSVMLDDEELRALGDSGCGVAHCPRTAVRLGYPVPRIAEMRKHGVRVGIGVDGGASNDGGTMLGDLRLGLLYHRTGATPAVDPMRDWMTPYDALLIATRTSAAMLGRDDIGHLAPGMAADLVAFDMRRAAYAGAMLDPLGALLMCGADSSATLTVVNGRIVVRDGLLLSADERGIVAGANAAMEALADRAAKATGWDFRSYGGGVPPQPEVSA